MIYNIANKEGIHTQVETFDDSHVVRLHRRSPFDGELYYMDIKLSIPTLIAYYGGNAHVQNIFPDLSADEREFIATGIPPSQWPKEAPEDKEEDGGFNDHEDCV